MYRRGLCLTFSLFACTQTPGLDEEGADELTDTDETGEAEGSGELLAARGIAILEVEANQATRVPIGLADGEWAGPEARNVHLIRDRDTLIRVHVEVAAGWAPHLVTARLRIVQVDGDTLVLDDERMIEASSQREELDSTFHFVLDAASSRAGASYEVELLERGEHQQAELPELASHTPSSGPAPVGFEDVAMEIKVQVAPVHYTGGGMDLLPSIDDEQLAEIERVLYEVNPVQTVRVELGEPFEYDQTPSSLIDLYYATVDAREAAGVAPNVYYMGLVDCGAPNCPDLAFTANIATDAILNAFNRTSIMVTQGYVPPENLVTAIGLNQGRMGVVSMSSACMPLSGSVDPNYPHPNGTIGNWGANPATLALYAPDERFDYMGFCLGYWVSDYTYEGAYDRIRTLTSWDNEAASSPAFLP